MAYQAKHLLLAPLDWGMGHTTRCIPLIRHLQASGHRVTFAGNAAQRALIARNLVVDTIHLDGYNITYGKSRNTFLVHLLAQVPGILKSIKQEHKWLQHQLDAHHYDGVITDNRYGLYTTHVPTAIMTHQLRIHTGMGNWADNIVQRLHYRLLNRFTERWVVDTPGEPNMAGSLSHPAVLPARTKYIGLLSQLQPAKAIAVTDTLLILLSGPEPQRTILARLLWKQAVQHNGSVVFIEGKANALQPVDIPPHIVWHAQVGHSQLQTLLQQAAMVICRSGYSTVMDLALLRKKAILIPTPGQAEQEYLGRYLHHKHVFYSTPQQDFHLIRALANVAQFPFVHADTENIFSQFIPVIDQWLSK